MKRHRFEHLLKRLVSIIYDHRTTPQNAWLLNSFEDTCQHINSLLNTVGLSGMNSTVIKHLSLGQKQRLGLARARKIQHPLDEPTNGLDPQGILDIREMILMYKEGRNVIVASHLILCPTLLHVLVLHRKCSIF